MVAPLPNAKGKPPKRRGVQKTSTGTGDRRKTNTGTASVAATTLTKHSILIAGHRTSISLERAFWERLGKVAAARKCSIASLVVEIDQHRGDANLSSAIRVFLLETFADRSDL